MLWIPVNCRMDAFLVSPYARVEGDWNVLPLWQKVGHGRGVGGQFSQRAAWLGVRVERRHWGNVASSSTRMGSIQAGEDTMGEPNEREEGHK